jgi:hypothetical protein
VTRDLKNYIAKHSKRSIPVGYSAADVRSILVDTWNYLQCTTTTGGADPSRADLFALNSYSWCGASTFTTSSYDVLASDFTSSSVPVFFSEYGCNKVAPRVFTEVPVIYGPLMTPVLSGGMVYEYSEEPDSYGIVLINSNGSAQILPDYDNLQKQFNLLNITYVQGLPAQGVPVIPPKCASSLITTSGFSSNFTIPSVPPGAQALIDNGINPAPSGKMVPVTATKVSQVVQQSNGDVIQNLEITILADDQSNNPSGATSTSSGASPSGTKKKNSGENFKSSHNILLELALLAAMWTFIL